MTDASNSIVKLLKEDPRYDLEAYQFVRDALSYAQDVMKLGKNRVIEDEDVHPQDELDEDASEPERHLSGQQLCQAIRNYAQEQYGYMAQVVLKNWGVTSTSDFGNIVYNLIRIEFMKKSPHDRRKDFDDVYDFDEAFRHQFQITMPSMKEPQ